jgi:rhodanese-related sulfurtransferase
MAVLSEDTTGEIVAAELKRLIDSREDIQVIDVREDFEYETGHIHNATLIPLSRILRHSREIINSREIDPLRPAVLYCQAGSRSLKALKILKESGFSGRLISLQGGIYKWSYGLDHAMSSAPGGIDLDDTNLKIDVKVNGQGVPLPVRYQDPAMIDIPGLVPSIRSIVPMTPLNIPVLFELTAVLGSALRPQRAIQS